MKRPSNTLMKLKNSSLCTNLTKAYHTIWKPKQQNLQVYELPDLYLSCNDLTVDRFLACLCKKDYRKLVISGEPTEEQLTTAWLTIVTEYNELKNIDISESKNWAASKELVRLHNHLYLLQQCIDFLTHRYSHSIASSFRRLGYRLKITSDNPQPADYMEQLFIAAETAKTKYIEIQQYNKQLKDFVKENEEAIPRYEVFEKTLTLIEEMQHTVYDFSTLTVSKFVQLENKYREMVTQLELKAQLKK